MLIDLSLNEKIVKKMQFDLQNIGQQFQSLTKYKRGFLPSYGRSLFNMPPPLKTYPDNRTIDLPKPETSGGPPLWEIIRERRSHRVFKSAPLSINEVGQLFWASQGITSERGGFGFRAAPSAGALYPTETYFLAARVEKMPAGLYHYNISKHAAELIKEGSLASELASAALDQDFIEKAPLTVIWTAIVARCAWKYLQRAYRYIYLDTAHIAQNLMLSATAMGLGTCGIGAFYDDEVNALIGVDGEAETVLYLCVVGKI